MDFGRNLLKKYGWNEGDGLGKNNTGIKNPLKPNYKFDNAGLGVDKAADFKNHWWERVYNDAANNIKVNQNGDDLSLSVKNKDSVEISTKDYSVKKLKKLKGNRGYGNFLQASTLTGENRETENPDKIEFDDLKLPEYKPLTDEELYAACGGRTAHKGARHGLQLKGKLSRIEEQEREFLAKLQDKSEGPDAADWKVVKSKKKSKRKLEENATEKPDEITEHLFTAEYCVKSKKKKKKEKQIDNELSTVLNTFSVEEVKISENCNDEENSTEGGKKKKKRKHKEQQFEIPEMDTSPATLNNECSSVKIKKKKKTKINQSEEEEAIVNETFLKEEENVPTTENRKNKKKLKRGLKVIAEDLGNKMSVDYIE